VAYVSTGRLPIERASKLGHVKIIQDPVVQRLIDAFERTDTEDSEDIPACSGNIDLSEPSDIENVVAIDGSEAAIPNTLQSHKKLAFIKASALLVQRQEVAVMKASPIVDPRDLAARLEGRVDQLVWTLPLSGIVTPGETVVSSIRQSVDHALRHWHLYDTLQFLVSREWLPSFDMDAHMDCVACGQDFYLPRSTKRFQCSHCSAPHTLSDYLTIVSGPPNDWAKEEAAISLRTIFETLVLMRFLVQYRDHPTLLKRTVFVKDGPLLLRAQLSRLVEPIRAFLEHLHGQGRELHIVGVEKTGDLVDHLALLRKSLVQPGDYFLPSLRYLHERIQGVPFVAAGYRNRVQYGAKVAVRLGLHHVIAFNVPTGQFLADPQVDGLYGFTTSMSVLSEMLSHRYENALIPLVLVNQVASISLRPSIDILQSFAGRLLGAGLR
jgi:hypothetical protein